MQALKPALLALVAQAPAAGAFVVPPPQQLPTGDERTSVAARPRLAAPVQASLAGIPLTSTSAPTGPSSVSIFTGAAIAGAVAAIFGRQQGRRTNVERYGEIIRIPGPPGFLKDYDPARGAEYYKWVQVRRKAKRTTKFIHSRRPQAKERKQLETLLEFGLTSWHSNADNSHDQGWEWNVWYPNDDIRSPKNWDMYDGPESHPDNPSFPAHSDGLQAQRGWAAATLGASPGLTAAGNVFAGAAAPQLGLAKKRSVAGVKAREERSGLVMHAHKKAASSSKNQGTNVKWKSWGADAFSVWGPRPEAAHGRFVRARQVLVRQSGMRVKPGANVIVGHDNTLNAKVDGIVQWRGDRPGHRQIYIIPHEYMENKCEWVSNGQLGPKEWEPWMTTTGGQRGNIKWHLEQKKAEFLESDKGKAWQEKKEKQKAKQRYHRRQVMRMYKYRKALRRGELGFGPRDGAQKQAADVTSGGESDSEAE